MYNNVSSTFRNLMLSGSGMISSKLVFDDFELSGDDIYSITYKAGSTDGNCIAPGTVYIPELEAEISASDKFFRNKKMIWYIGLSEDGVKYEYAKVCTVWIKTVEKNTDTIKLTAYSNIYATNKYYTSTLAYPATVNEVIAEISSKTGLVIDTSEVPMSLLSAKINEQPTGYTYRQVLGQIAGLFGCFAVPDRDDSKLMFKWYEDSKLTISEDFDEPQLEDNNIIIKSLACNANGRWITTSLNTWVMQWSCMYMTNDILGQLLAKISDLTYRVGSFNLLSGNILIDPWDIVTVSYNGETYKMPVGLLEHKYDGGLSTSVQTPGDTDGETTLSSPNTSQQTTERLMSQIIEAQQMLADKIDTVELTAFKAEINNLIADKASIQQLEAMQANINILTVNKADITDLDAVRADIVELNASKANISELNAAIGSISNLSAVVANITTILSGQVGTGTLQAINITAENTTISEAAIKELIAKRITVDDLLAGKISTDKFEIVSDDGGLNFKGATAQWKDENGVVRVQIGKDAQGNFTFTLFDATGKGVLLDSSGIHENAVPDGLIVDSMVADNANIAGRKLDIDSVIESINEDGSTSLKSSKIVIDATGQTLDIAFKTVETKTSELEKTITSQGESISFIEGQIKQKIWQSDITTALKDTETKISTLSDKYNDVSDTLNSHTQEIADIQTTIEKKADESTVSAIESRVTTFEQNLDGFKLSVSMTYATQASLNSTNDKLASAESSITQLAGNIALKVEKNGIISAINQSPEKITIDAERVDIDGAVTFINNGYTTKINGDAIETGTITADKIKVDSLQSISARIGGFTIGKNYIANGPKHFNVLGPEETFESISISIPSDGVTVQATITTGSISHLLSSKYPICIYNSDTSDLLGTINSAETYVTLIAPSSSNSGYSVKAYYTGAVNGVVFEASCGISRNLNLRVTWYQDKKDSVYLGLDGISCGENFSVDSRGDLKAVSGNIAGFKISDQLFFIETEAAEAPVYCFLNSVGLTGEDMNPAPNSILLASDAYYADFSDAKSCSPSLFITQGGELVSLYGHDYYTSLRIKDAGIYMQSGHFIRSTYPGYGEIAILGQNANGDIRLGSSDQPSNTNIYARYDSQIQFRVGATVKAYINSSGLTNSSDERLKSDIKDMDDKYVQIADKLKPKTFKYKDDNSAKTNMGFVAQDLETIISELGIESDSFAPLGKDKEEYMGINYIQLIPILWAKVQQLSEEIEKLKSEKEDLICQ